MQCAVRPPAKVQRCWRDDCHSGLRFLSLTLFPFHSISLSLLLSLHEAQIRGGFASEFYLGMEVFSLSFSLSTKKPKRKSENEREYHTQALYLSFTVSRALSLPALACNGITAAHFFLLHFVSQKDVGKQKTRKSHFALTSKLCSSFSHSLSFCCCLCVCACK